jgi:hypothetical protein
MPCLSFDLLSHDCLVILLFITKVKKVSENLSGGHRDYKNPLKFVLSCSKIQHIIGFIIFSNIRAISNMGEQYFTSIYEI